MEREYQRPVWRPKFPPGVTEVNAFYVDTVLRLVRAGVEKRMRRKGRPARDVLLGTLRVLRVAGHLPVMAVVVALYIRAKGAELLDGLPITEPLSLETDAYVAWIALGVLAFVSLPFLQMMSSLRARPATAAAAAPVPEAAVVDGGSRLVAREILAILLGGNLAAYGVILGVLFLNVAFPIAAGLVAVGLYYLVGGGRQPEAAIDRYAADAAERYRR